MGALENRTLLVSSLLCLASGPKLLAGYGYQLISQCEVENWQALLSSDRRMAVASWLLEHPTSSQSIRRLSKQATS